MALKRTIIGGSGSGSGGAVESVNGETGEVVIDAADVGAAAASHTHVVADLPTGTTASTVALGNDSRLSNQRVPTDGSVTNAKVSATAAIALSKLATNPLDRGEHTGDQAQSTITGLEDRLAAIEARLDVLETPPE